MKSMYQGEIDVFCAPYAVLNALRHLFGIRLLTCRNLLHETFKREAEDAHNWELVLNQGTDYCNLVDDMLARVQTMIPLVIERPFNREDSPDAAMLWAHLQNFFGTSTSGRAVVFQFIRYLSEDRTADIKHWTCTHTMQNKSITLFDSSRNEGALTHIEYTKLIALHDGCEIGKVCIVPHSIRYLKRVRG